MILILLDRAIDEQKERLRLNHELGQQLVAEIIRLEHERTRFLLHSEAPTLVLVRSA